MDKLHSVFALRMTYVGQNIYFVDLRVIDKYGFFFYQRVRFYIIVDVFNF